MPIPHLANFENENAVELHMRSLPPKMGLVRKPKFALHHNVLADPLCREPQAATTKMPGNILDHTLCNF